MTVSIFRAINMSIKPFRRLLQHYKTVLYVCVPYCYSFSTYFPNKMSWKSWIPKYRLQRPRCGLFDLNSPLYTRNIGLRPPAALVWCMSPIAFGNAFMHVANP